jgi:hypothetical protein
MIAGLKPLSHPGSQLFFDYIALEAYQDPAKYEFSRIKARFDAFGEVMSFGFRQGGDHVRQWLASQGLQLLQHYTALDMVAVYERMVGAPAPSKGAPWANLCVARF